MSGRICVNGILYTKEEFLRKRDEEVAAGTFRSGTVLNFGLPAEDKPLWTEAEYLLKKEQLSDRETYRLHALSEAKRQKTFAEEYEREYGRPPTPAPEADPDFCVFPEVDSVKVVGSMGSEEEDVLREAAWEAEELAAAAREAGDR